MKLLSGVDQCEDGQDALKGEEVADQHAGTVTGAVRRKFGKPSRHHGAEKHDVESDVDFLVAAANMKKKGVKRRSHGKGQRDET